MGRTDWGERKGAPGKEGAGALWRDRLSPPRLFSGLALLGILVLAVAWRWHFASRTRIYTYDSYYYMLLARSLREHLSYAVSGHAHFKFMPLYPAVMAFLGLFTGKLEFLGKITNLLPASLCVFPIYGMGKMVFGRRAGLFAALLFAFEPVSSAWSSIPMSEGLFTLLLCLSAFLFLRWWKGDGGGAPYPSVVLAGLAMVTRWEGFLFFACLALFLAHAWWRGRITGRQYLLCCALALVPFSLLVVRNLVTFGRPVKSAYLNELAAFRKEYETFPMGQRLINYFVFKDTGPIGIADHLYNYGYLLFGYAGLAMALLGARTRRHASFLLAWFLLVGPLHFIWYFYNLRFLFPVIPVLCLGAGALFGLPWNPEGRRLGRETVVFFTLLSLLLSGVLFTMGERVTEDLFVRNILYLEDDWAAVAEKEAALWLRENGEEGAGVTAKLPPLVSFYLGRDALFLGPWEDFEPADIDPADFLAQARARGVRYLITSTGDYNPAESLEVAGIDPEILPRLNMLKAFYVPPGVKGNAGSFAFVFEIPKSDAASTREGE